ncbi:prolyl 4-hydroxylase subunit alpha-2-like [Drosophila grimshawi]|uniref:prolyl 4-hydroxylase subunit alpha-2-like n=1 Tax=Drosophila grimshawi TaxID=7222 RepID=UPI0013EF47E3|nr:prolyl 4-hydroxylase subunit alpha-2-like [Drosophila grimshawi]
MVKLILLEAKLIENLNRYTDELKRKLDILKRVVPRLRAESDKGMTQKEDYISNPLNAFSLIRRMQEDWIDWKVFIEEPVGWSHIFYLAQYKSELPSPTDLREACEAIQRLSDVYNLSIGDMVKGLLNGKQYESSLNAMDTFRIGQFLHQHRKPHLARQWFAETGKWLISNQTTPTLLGADPERLMYFLASAFAKNKYYSIAVPILDHALMMGNQAMKTQVFNLRSYVHNMIRNEPNLKPVAKENIASYSLGCRGQFVPQSNLHCEYKMKTSPFLRLAPLKMEIVLLNPFIVVFHDALSPQEIDYLQNLARPLLKRTTVHVNGKYVSRRVRTSKGAWLERDLNNLTRRIERRVVDMTELSMQGSEAYNIMNYGLGGHYAAHYDFFNTTKQQTSETGDRIATVLFYLSDVEQGGATVFPNLKLAVSPERGMALFWYNLLDNGTGDTRTLHGGCPVLVGSKWVMTLWIHERAQLFTRPCLSRCAN